MISYHHSFTSMGYTSNMIRDVQLDDAHDICEIYNYYVKNTIITFDETAVSEEKMKENITAVVPNLPWLVFEKIAHFREVGYKFGKWIDVGYWELILAY